MGKTITVLAPGSVANVGSGYDMMGFAVDGLGDRLGLEENHSGKLRIFPSTGFSKEIPTDPAKNTAGVAILEMCQDLHINPGFDIHIEKLSPVGSGLGASAASATGAVFALNELLGKPYAHKEALLPFALKGEAVASGSYHADNVAPSLLGGLLAIRSLDPIEVMSIPIPASFRVILVHPHVEVLTKMARKLVPDTIPIGKVTKQMGNLAAFIVGMVNVDRKLLKNSFFDYLAVPYRAPLIPGFYEVQNIAIELGAIGCSISGSGPTVFAIIESEKDYRIMAEAMKTTFLQFGIESDAFFSGFNTSGVILE